MLEDILEDAIMPLEERLATVELKCARHAPFTDADITARIAVLTDFVRKVGATHGQTHGPGQNEICMPGEVMLARESALIAAYQAIERLARES